MYVNLEGVEHMLSQVQSLCQLKQRGVGYAYVLCESVFVWMLWKAVPCLWLSV